MDKQKQYVSSKEAKKLLKVSDCKLAHLRIEGRLSFLKKGNAFMYEVEELKRKQNDLAQ